MKFTPEQVAYVQANVGKVGNEVMGRAIGLSKRQVRHIRTTLNLTHADLNGAQPRFEWTDERLELVRKHYIEEGQTAQKVADLLGTSRYAVRGVALSRGWERTPEVKASARPAAPAKVSDSDLVAQFLASKPVTVCQPGWACGLTQIETQIYAANPARKTMAQRRKEGLARRRAMA